MILHTLVTAARSILWHKEPPKPIRKKQVLKLDMSINELKAEIAKARAHHRPVAHLHAKLREAVNRELKAYVLYKKRAS